MILTDTRVRRFLILLFVLLVVTPCVASARQTLPILKANSATIDIQDGDHLLKGYWTVHPDRRCDVYYAKRSKRTKRVTFRTDVDSLSFDVKPGRDYDFVVLLKNKDRCLTRISALRRSYRRILEKPSSAPDVVPFTLGPDNKIHIRGTVNHSEPLDLLFDTGADISVLYPSALAKRARLVFDGTEEDTGIGGTATRPISQDSHLEIAGLSWDHEGILFVEKQVDNADGIVGFNVFEDKFVEIDYDRKVLIIRDSAPQNLDEYRKVDTRLIGTLPGVRATLSTGSTTVTDWFVVDTGSNANLRLNYEFSTKYKLDHQMYKLGASTSGGVGSGTIRSDVVLLPTLTIGNVRLSDVPIDLSSSAEASPSPSNLGMGVLKRFNTIFDFPRDRIYLRPNYLTADPFPRHRRVPNVALLCLLAIGLFCLIALTRVVLRKRARALRGRRYRTSG